MTHGQLAFIFTALVCMASAPDVSAQVEGFVRDGTTQAAIPGALVSLQGSTVETVTGADGSFELPDVTGAVVVVGAMKGYFNRSVTVDTPAAAVAIELDPVPSEDDPDYTLITASTCSACHHTIEREWASSGMAHAGTNTWVYDVYSGNGTEYGDGGFVYTRDSVHAADNPASECASCHQPEGWLKAPFTALADVRSPEAQHGVSCEICHKIADIDDSRPNFPGIYPGVVTMTRPAGGWQVVYGVLGDVDYEVEGTMRAAYQPQLRAEVCAACHQDKNDPDGDGDFEDADGVISEPTYLEWKESAYADPTSEHYATCVDCHMRPTDADLACSILIGAYTRPPGEVRSHTFEGTTAEYLENAVTLAADVSVDGGAIKATVTVTNDKTGHHVPTGVTIRNMILLVEAFDGATRLPDSGGQTIHALAGEGDPAEGYYAGLPGKLYAKRNHGADGKGPVFFTEATGIEVDNRIVALASDTTDYRFALPPGAGDVKLDVRLIYRRSWRALVDAKRWTEDGHGNPLADVLPPHFGHLMERATFLCSAAEGCREAPDEPVVRPPDDADSSSGCAAGPSGGGGGAAWLALLVVGWCVTRRRRWLLLLGALVALGPGCDEDSARGPVAPEAGERFDSLAQWHLFDDIVAQQPAAGVIPFEPISPLYTDYAYKRRFLWVPPGETIGYEAVDRWRFPIGTILVKTFSYPHDMRDPSAGERLLETRVLHRNEDGWQTAAYVYDEAQTEATLRLAGATLDTQWIAADGRERTNSYVVPNLNECSECHGEGEALDTLGGVTRQLDRAHDYGDGPVNQIDHLAALGLFESAPPPTAERVRLVDPFGDAPLGERARSYLDANCGACHSLEGYARNYGLQFDYPSSDPEVATPGSQGVCKIPTSAGGATCGLTYDVIPGDPGHSIVICRMSSGNAQVRMPPIGTALAHVEGVTLIRQWIEAMTGSCD